MEEEGHSFIINVPKPRVFSKKSSGSLILQESVHTKRSKKLKLWNTRDDKLSKYLLLNNQPMKSKVLSKDENLLSYIRFADRQRKADFKHRMGTHIFNSYKFKMADLRSRLYTEDPANDVLAVTDVDKSFFHYVNGRLLPPTKSTFKSTVTLYNRILILKHEIALRKDTVLNIDTNFEKEQQTYDLALKRFNNQTKYFDKFVLEDYERSMTYLDNQDALKDKVMIQEKELQNTANAIFTIMSQLIGLEYRYGLLQRYGRFLYYLSPSYWRSHNREFALSIDIETKGFDYGIAKEEDTFTVLFDNMKTTCFGNLVKPVLYFSHPSEMLKVFGGIEEQQLNHFTHVSYVTPYVKSLKERVGQLKNLVAQDSHVIANLIEGFEGLIEHYDERSKDLEAKFFQILHGTFYKSVGTAEVLQFVCHLEFCYEKVFSEKVIRTDIVMCAKALEQAHLYYTRRLDEVATGSIRETLRQFMEQEDRRNKRSVIAARELRNFEHLNQSLLKAYMPALPVQRLNKKESTLKPKKVYKPKPLVEKRRLSLTEAEKEYLRLFTTWTCNEDPALYLHSFSLPQ